MYASPDAPTSAWNNAASRTTTLRRVHARRNRIFHLAPANPRFRGEKITVSENAHSDSPFRFVARERRRRADSTTAAASVN